MHKVVAALLFFLASVAAVTPNQIHLSTTGDPSTSITVTWQTTSTAASSVQYGTTIALGSSVTGSEYRYSGYEGYMHNATLSSLSPATTYYYEVGDGTDWSEVYSFTTAPPLGSTTQFTVVAWGDQGHWNTAVPNAAASINPQIVAIAGDLAYGGDEDDVDDFFQNGQPLASKALFMAAPGNHEYGDFGQDSDSLLTFVNRFAFPANSMYSYLNERTYSFNYGNSHFVFLDLGRRAGEDDDPVDSDHVAAWLDADLAAVPASVTWKVVVLHFNLYASSNSHPMRDSGDERRRFEPVFRRRVVDLVVEGHVHAYERMYPLADPDVETDPDPDNLVFETDYVNPAYPVYLLAGTGGNCCYEEGGGTPWSVTALAEVGYVKLVFSGNTLTEEFRSPTHALRDTFTIIKGASSQPPANDTNTSTQLLPGTNATNSTNTSSGSSTASFDFTISAPSSLSMLQSSSTAVVINGTQLFGLPTQSASLTAICPASISCSFASPVNAFNFSTQLFISTSPSTPTATHFITISATSGSLTRSIVLSLSVVSAQQCTENWQCTVWTSCSNNMQYRTCVDVNNCGTIYSKPVESIACIQCIETWRCTSFSSCVDNVQRRTCIDLNNCGTVDSKPADQLQCGVLTVQSPFQPTVTEGLPLRIGGGAEEVTKGGRNFLNSVMASIVSFFSWIASLFA